MKDNLIQKENSKWKFNKEVIGCFEILNFLIRKSTQMSALISKKNKN